MLVGTAGVIPSQATPSANLTAATLGWLGCVAAFADDAGRPGPLAAAATHARLERITSLDPSFSEAWLHGTTMLRVVDGPDGAHARAFVARGRSVRPDLPWALVAPAAP